MILLPHTSLPQVLGLQMHGFRVFTRTFSACSHITGPHVALFKLCWVAVQDVTPVPFVSIHVLSLGDCLEANLWAGCYFNISLRGKVSHF